MYHDSVLDPVETLAPAVLPEALCIGNPDFTVYTDAERAERCIALCRICPELQDCRRQLVAYRTTSEWRLGEFSGVWAGVKFARGRPSKRYYKTVNAG